MLSFNFLKLCFNFFDYFRISNKITIIVYVLNVMNFFFKLRPINDTELTNTKITNKIIINIYTKYEWR